MSNVRYLESMLDHHWPEMHRNFPAIEKPVLIPARAIRGAAPMYMRRYIDQDENSFYMFVKADPRNGDASREMAKQFFDDLLYNKLGGQSSYDMDSGMTPQDGDPLFGTMTREEAISKEVLPAQDDRNYQQYYDEQMNQMQGDADNSEETKDDSDVIDIDDEGNIIEPGNRAVAKSQGTAVGLVKPIWYAIDLHIPAGGAQLGYSGAGRLGRGGSRRLLRNSEDELTSEEIEFNESIMNKFRNYFN